MEPLEEMRMYLTTKLRDYTESLTKWEGNLQDEANELYENIKGNAQLEHVEYDLKQQMNLPDFSIQHVVDIMNSAMEALEQEDNTYLSHITVKDENHTTVSIYSLISFVDFYYQYNIGNVKFSSENDKLVLYILKYIDNEDVLDMEIDTNEKQILPSVLGASRLITTLEHFHDEGYSDVEFTLESNEEVLLLFLKNGEAKTILEKLH